MGYVCSEVGQASARWRPPLLASRRRLRDLPVTEALRNRPRERTSDQRLNLLQSLTDQGTIGAPGSVWPMRGTGEAVTTAIPL